ncbi:outer membrane protein assembly factor BamD [Marinomonas agarivorans]|nr:outer membrane protein assembly factor BamD [Marinomonas agarivorans]
MGLRHSLLRLSGIVVFSFVLVACSNAPKKIEPDLPEDEYYQEAQKALEQGRPTLAVAHLTDLDLRYPFGKYSQQAKIELIYANYLAGDYAASHAAADRFIRNFPDSKQLDYAFYYKALSTYKSAESLSFRYLNQDLSQRDTSEFVQSFNEFAALLKRYPNSAYSIDAKARMIFLRNTIAEHEIKVARYYFKRNAPLAALNRGQTVLKDYPSSNSIEAALGIIVQAYNELEEKELATRYLALLRTNYPQSSFLDKQGNFITPKKPADANPGFWYWISLGLID